MKGVVRALLAVLALTASCSRPAERATTALSPSPSPPASASPSPTPNPGDRTIVVKTPTPGDELTAPITVSGTADVFEGTVSVRILDARGAELAATFTTATCGSGCRGAFSTDLFFIVEQREPGTVEVFESSAKDGTPLHLVSIPVVLLPGL